MRIGLIGFIVFFVIISCGNDKNARTRISEEEMIDLLVDIHKTDALLTRAENRGEVKKKEAVQYYKGMLDKHHINRQEFDSAFDYYSHDFKKFDKIYNQVIVRLQKEEDSVKLSKKKD